MAVLNQHFSVHIARLTVHIARLTVHIAWLTVHISRLTVHISSTNRLFKKMSRWPFFTWNFFAKSLPAGTLLFPSISSKLSSPSDEICLFVLKSNLEKIQNFKVCCTFCLFACPTFLDDKGLAYFSPFDRMFNYLTGTKIRYLISVRF